MLESTYVKRKKGEVRVVKYMCDTVELRKAMAEKKIKTVKKLSDLSEVNRNTLGKVVNGEEQPSAAVMYKLVDALDLVPERAGIIFFSRNLRNT